MSRSSLQLFRKQKTLEELQSAEARQGHHIEGAERLKQRESAFQRLSYKENPTKTLRSITEERKKDMIEYNSQNFGKISIGVHGKDLPKYSENDDVKQWWK